MKMSNGARWKYPIILHYYIILSWVIHALSQLLVLTPPTSLSLFLTLVWCKQTSWFFWKIETQTRLKLSIILIFKYVVRPTERRVSEKNIIKQSNKSDSLIFLIFWIIMSYFIEGRWKTDKDNRMSGHMTIILFPVLY